MQNYASTLAGYLAADDARRVKQLLVRSVAMLTKMCRSSRTRTTTTTGSRKSGKVVCTDARIKLRRFSTPSIQQNSGPRAIQHFFGALGESRAEV